MEKFEEIIWHDPAAYYPENNYIYERLSSFAKTTRFTDCLEANNYIQNQNVKICVITSGKNGEKLLKSIHDNTSVIGFIIFCMHPEKHEKWAANYKKIIKIVKSGFEEVLRNLRYSFNNYICSYIFSNFDSKEFQMMTRILVGAFQGNPISENNRLDAREFLHLSNDMAIQFSFFIYNLMKVKKNQVSANADLIREER